MNSMEDFIKKNIGTSHTISFFRFSVYIMSEYSVHVTLYDMVILVNAS